ncbi:hypothetical protein BDV95DRAFT_595571 [Massariosphaeria phaeospora]|uniref:Uncharacterized protein n=1 Tax=Massariosphaeria phaeospora TaxID=100035 RepID=A0A7C8MDW1_9PLEO|nr:hypothetical protein BDV95DRAFT_595571 [Massariosphaeria phaeospora]
MVPRKRKKSIEDFVLDDDAATDQDYAPSQLASSDTGSPRRVQSAELPTATQTGQREALHASGPMHASSSPAGSQLHPLNADRLESVNARVASRHRTLQRPPRKDVYDIPVESDEDNEDHTDEEDNQTVRDMGPPILRQTPVSPAPPRRVRAAGRKGQSKTKRVMEDLHRGSDVSDCADASDDSTDEELDFAPMETQVAVGLQRTLTREDLRVPDLEDVGMLPGEALNEQTSFVKLVKAIDQDGLLPALEAARDAEAASGSVLGKEYARYPMVWQYHSFSTLCSMHPRIIQELVHGNLVIAANSDADLRQTLDANYERGKVQPNIYARVLTDTSGQSMSSTNAQRLARWLRRYISDDLSVIDNTKHREVFYRIDRQFQKWKRADTARGQRRYLQTDAYDRSDGRLQVIRTFCVQLERRCGDGGRLSPPLQYIGYAAKADTRERQHEACGKSSNWLASFVQAVCNVAWEKGAYQMHFFVVCLLSEEAQGMVGEMLLTRLPNAYYNSGGGFCVDVAGKSLESMHFAKLAPDQRADQWHEYAQWVKEHTRIYANWELQKQRELAVIARVDAEGEAVKAVWHKAREMYPMYTERG